MNDEQQNRHRLSLKAVLIAICVVALVFAALVLALPERAWLYRFIMRPSAEMNFYRFKDFVRSGFRSCAPAGHYVDRCGGEEQKQCCKGLREVYEANSNRYGICSRALCVE